MGINVTLSETWVQFKNLRVATHTGKKKILYRFVPEPGTLCLSATAVQASAGKSWLGREDLVQYVSPQRHRQQHTAFQGLSLLTNTFLGT